MKMNFALRRGKAWMPLAFWMLLLLVFAACSQESRTAGGVTDIGNSIAGHIVLADGVSPAVGARVVLYEDSWKYAVIADSLETWTDSAGNFSLDNVSDKMRTLRAEQGKNQSLLNLSNDSVQVVLGNSRSLEGKISSESSGSVRIVGTHLTSAVDENGVFAFEEVPSGMISLVYMQDSVPESYFAFWTTDNRQSVALPELKTLTADDSVLVLADASLYADSSYGVALGSSVSTAVSVALSYSPMETLRNFVMPVKFNNLIDFATFSNPDSFQIVSEWGKEQNFEVDYWTPRASQGVLWVRLDSIAAGDGNVNLYIIRRCSDSSSRAFLKSDSVVAALHLNGDASLNFPSDSDKAFGFIGYGTTISEGQSISVDPEDLFEGDFTLSVWAYWNGRNNKHQVLFSSRASADSIGIQWYYDNINSTFAVYNFFNWDSLPGALVAMDSLTWNRVSLVSQKDSISMFVNGIAVGNPVAFSVRPFNAPLPFRVGGNEVGEESWNGALDEIRVDKKARSAEWLRMEYETQAAAGNILRE